MNSFEFIMVLVSIIIGLGIAELLKTVSKIIRGNLEGGLLHILWSVNMLNMLIQCFWAYWVYEDRVDWTYNELILILLGPIIMYIIASLLYIPNDRYNKLDEYFINHRLPFFLLFLSLMIVFTFNDYVFTKGDFSRHLVRGTAFTLFSFLAYTKSRVLHISGAILFILIQGFFIFNWSFILSTLEA